MAERRRGKTSGIDNPAAPPLPAGFVETDAARDMLRPVHGVAHVIAHARVFAGGDAPSAAPAAGACGGGHRRSEARAAEGSLMRRRAVLIRLPLREAEAALFEGCRAMVVPLRDDAVATLRDRIIGVDDAPRR